MLLVGLKLDQDGAWPDSAGLPYIFIKRGLDKFMEGRSVQDYWSARFHITSGFGTRCLQIIEGEQQERGRPPPPTREHSRRVL